MPVVTIAQDGGVDAWVRAVVALGGSAAAARVSAADLAGRYAEAHRRYHTLAHVHAVVRDAAWLCGELAVLDRDCVVLAACAHDVVYDARPGADELASAAWAQAALTAAGVEVASAARVAQLVLATAEHAGDPSDRGLAALLDADLAILAADSNNYAAYVTAVRAEYDAVPDAAWREGRAAVLRGLLAHETLYLSAPAQQRWEALARANVERELAGL